MEHDIDFYILDKHSQYDWLDNYPAKKENFIRDFLHAVSLSTGTISQSNEDDIRAHEYGGKAILMYKHNSDEFLGLVHISFINKNNKFKKYGIDEFVYIDNMVVSATHWGKGLCSLLLKKIFDQELPYQNFILDVDTNNTGAVKCYKKNGFEQLGDEENGVIYMIKESNFTGGGKHFAEYRNKYFKYKTKYLFLRKSYENIN